MSTPRTLTKPQATKLARKLYADGKKAGEIATVLAAEGYTSAHTQKPLASTSVYSLLKKKAGKAPPPRRGGSEGKVDPALRLKLVRSLCEQHDMDAEDRIAAISLLLN